MARRLIDRNRAREARRQVLLLDRLAGQFRGRLERELAAAMRDMVDRWEATHHVEMPRGFLDRIGAVYQQMAQAAVDAFAGRILGQGKHLGLVLERKEDFAQTMSRRASQYIQQESVRRRIQQVTETTRRQIVGAVDRGYREGSTLPEVASSIRGLIPEIARFRADTIARTETHGAANYGSNEAAKLTGLPLKKEWLAAEDERTRETHKIAGDGGPIGMDEKFEVGNSRLDYPGDPAGDPEEVINCRCTLGYLVDDGIDSWTDPAGAPAAAPGLVDVQPPASQFAYESAPMPSTAAEAAKFIVDYGIASASRLEGMKIPAMKEAFRAALEVTERFGLAPIAGVGPATRFGMRQIKGANAAVLPNYKLLHLPTNFGDVARYKEHHARALASAPKYEASMRANLIKFARNHDPEVALRAEKMAPGSYGWTLSSMGDPAQHAKNTMYHEYGHILHLFDKKIGAEIDAFLYAERPRLKGWANLLSEYAHSDNREYVAEAFALYMHKDKSEHYRIHPKLLAIFQKLDRKT